MPRLSPFLFGLHLAAMIAYCLVTLAGGEQWLPLATMLTVVFFFAFSLSHLLEARGWRIGLALFSSAFALTLIFEAVGVATGLVFGNYTYSTYLGPKALDLVPLLIPIAWFMVLYPAFAVTRFVLRGFVPATVRRLAGWRLALLQSALAAAAMTAWDLSLDPRMVSAGYWTWHEGGIYFGVPLSNFAGWLITSFTIYLVWQIIDRPAATDDEMLFPPAGSAGGGRVGDGERVRLAALSRHAVLPVAAYIVTWIGESLANVLFWSGPLVGIAVFAGMGVFAFPALVLLARHMPLRLPLVSRAQARS